MHKLCLWCRNKRKRGGTNTPIPYGVAQVMFVGLNEAYGVVRSNLLCKDPLPSLSNACSFLVSEEINMARLIVDIVAFEINSYNYKRKEPKRKPKC